jgi:hypothetical protein
MKEFIEKLIGRLEEQKTSYREIRKNTYCRRTEMDDCDSCRADHYLDARLEGINKAIKIVNQLAEEYNGGWISVNDRLPEENGKYIVYYRKWSFGNYLPKFDEKEIRILRYSTNGWFFPTYGDTEAEKDIHREVLAWQPLPAPYQPKGE